MPKKMTYPEGPPQGNSESKRGYPKESWNTKRYPKGAFPGNADHAGKAPGSMGKGYRKKAPDLLAGEQTKAFPANPGQFE